MNLCSPAHVVLITLTRGVCATSSADRTEGGFKKKCVWVGEGCVCLLWLCCSKWWCTQTCMISPMTGVGGLRSAFFALFPCRHSLSQSDVHISSRRWQTACGALSPSSLSRRHLRLLLCIAPRTNTHSDMQVCTQNAQKTCVGLAAFS